MSKKGYKNGKRAYRYSSSDNSFDAKLMRAFYTKEYLEKLERQNNTENSINDTSNKEQDKKQNTVKHSTKKVVRKTTTQDSSSNKKNVITSFKATLFIIFLILGIILAMGIVFFTPYVQTAISSYEAGIDTTRIDVAKVPHIYDKDGNLLCVMYGYYDTRRR